MVKWIKNLFRNKTILDELSIVLVDKIGLGWYNLHSKDGDIYEFQYDEVGSVHIYSNNNLVFSSDDYSESFSIYISVKSKPRISK